ncbi:MAG: hypothetical protein ACPG4T_19955, partial [Nannocystaceae bacterium]
MYAHDRVKMLVWKSAPGHDSSIFMHRSALLVTLLTFACNNAPPAKKDFDAGKSAAPATPKKSQESTPKKPPSPKEADTGFGDELKKLNASINALEKRAKNYPKQWLHI